MKIVKRSGGFKPGELRLASLPTTWDHLLHLMSIANMGIPGARRQAELVMDRYFERIDEEPIP